MTKARLVILSLLREADEPLSAQKIAAKLNGCCDQVTIYRTLQYLEHHGYADSFILHCSAYGTQRYYSATPQKSEQAHHHWFHCEKCHRFIDLGDCKIDYLSDVYAKEHHIKVTSHTLYFTGICDACL